MSQSVASTQVAASGRLIDVVRRRVAGALGSSQREALALAGLLLFIFCGFVFRLGSVIDADGLDEGTYLYAGKLLAKGLMPYRDFFVAHPPGIILLAGGWERLFGSDVMPARIAYMVLILLSTVPLYVIGRALTHSSAAGLLSVATYSTGMLFLANMGRTVRLEPLMNGFLIAGFACYLLRPSSLRFRVLLGALCAGAILVKLVAVVPVGLLVAGDLLWSRPDRRFLRSWTAAAAGGAMILVPALPWLLQQPHFLDDVVRSQLSRPGLPLLLRTQYMAKASLRYPAVPAAMVAAVWFILRARDRNLRIISLITVGTAALLVLAFRTFFVSYVVQLLPWVAVVFTLIFCDAAQRIARRQWQLLVAVAAVVLGGIAPLLYGEVYSRSTPVHTSAPRSIVSHLTGGRGYVYSLSPVLALWSGRELYPWYFSADSYLGRITGRVGEDDLLKVFAGSQDVVLEGNELETYPRAKAYLDGHFQVSYEYAPYALWIRSAGDQQRSAAAR